MPFSIASLKDTTAARVGVTECVNHDLLRVYPVLTEKAGEFVAQFKTTVVLLPVGPLVLYEVPFEKELYESEYKIEDKEILDLLAQSLDRKQAKKSKKSEKKKEMPGTEATVSTEGSK